MRSASIKLLGACLVLAIAALALASPALGAAPPEPRFAATRAAASFGTSLGPSPITGTVTTVGTTGWHREMTVPLNQGDLFAIRLMADAPKGLAVGLLPPSAVSIYDDFVAWGDSDSYPTVLRYMASVPGTYTVMVFADSTAPQSTSFTYYADWVTLEASATATMRNIGAETPVMESEVETTGAVSELGEWAEVRGTIPLTKGEGLHLRLVPTSLGDVDLRVFGPDVTDIYSSKTPVAESAQPAGNSEELMFRLPADGPYFPTVWAWRGSNISYRLESRTTSPTTLTGGTSAGVLGYGAQVRITGQLLENSDPLGGETVKLEKYSGSGWTDLAISESATGTTWPSNAPTVTAGSVAFRQNLTTNTRFRLNYPGLFWYRTPATSANYDVGVFAYLPTPSVPSKVYRGRRFKITGDLRPRHASGSYPVQLTIERYSGSRVLERKRVRAKAYNYGAYSRYSAYVTLKTASYNWRVKAYHYGDSMTATGGNLATTSGWKRFRVRR